MTDKASNRKLNGTGRDDKTNPGNSDSLGPTFNVHNIYVKDLSLESPHSPEIFNEEWDPKVDFDLQLSNHVLSEPEAIHEVVMHLTVTVKLKNEKTAFLIEVKQAGIFSIPGFSPEILDQILGITCPGVIFPYARETITNTVMRAGFPQLLLPTINFEAMYAHRQENAKKEAEAGQGRDTMVV